MSQIRLFTPQMLAVNKTLELENKAQRHAIQVLRLKENQTLTLFNGDGYDYKGTIVKATKTALVKVSEKHHNNTESGLEISLIQCISRNDKMETTLQKATELGVASIQPVFSARSTAVLNGQRRERKTERWISILQHACEQSGRSRIPKLHKPVSLEEWLDNTDPGPTGLVLAPKADISISSIDFKSNYLSLLVGPEGGLSKREIEAANNSGFTSISMGPRILRTETAGPAALSILQSRFGDI